MLRDRSVNNQFASVWQPKLRHCAAVIINTCTYTNTLSRALIFDFSSLFQPASVPTAPWKHTPAEHGGLTDTKISIIEQLAYKNKASNIVLQETQCTTADKLVIPKFSLAGSILSRNHGLAAFVHERLEWSLVDQSPDQSETEWLCVDVVGYKIANVYKPPRSLLTPTTIPAFPHTVCTLATSIASMSTGATPSPDGKSLDSGATSNNLGQPKGNSQFLLSLLERRHQPRPSWASARTAECRTDVS